MYFIILCLLFDIYIFSILVAENYRSNSIEKTSAGGQTGQHGGATSTPQHPLEVITISDSEDDSSPELKALPLLTEAPPSSGQTSGCPSVMTLTPGGTGTILYFLDICITNTFNKVF